MTQRIHRKIVRTPEEIARLKADRERYQREKPSRSNFSLRVAMRSLSPLENSSRCTRQ